MSRGAWARARLHPCGWAGVRPVRLCRCAPCVPAAARAGCPTRPPVTVARDLPAAGGGLSGALWVRGAARGLLPPACLWLWGAGCSPRAVVCWLCLAFAPLRGGFSHPPARHCGARLARHGGGLSGAGALLPAVGSCAGGHLRPPPRSGAAGLVVTCKPARSRCGQLRRQGRLPTLKAAQADGRLWTAVTWVAGARWSWSPLYGSAAGGHLRACPSLLWAAGHPRPTGPLRATVTWCAAAAPAGVTAGTAPGRRRQSAPPGPVRWPAGRGPSGHCPAPAQASAPADPPSAPTPAAPPSAATSRYAESSP